MAHYVMAELLTENIFLNLMTGPLLIYLASVGERAMIDKIRLFPKLQLF